MGDTKLDTPTVVDGPEPSGPETHRRGWLTIDAYMAWVAAGEGVFMSEAMLATPKPFSETEHEAERKAA